MIGLVIIALLAALLIVSAVLVWMHREYVELHEAIEADNREQAEAQLEQTYGNVHVLRRKDGAA